MKRMTYQYPKSSFLANEKDMELITTMIFKNENLKKYLYYNTKNCLSKPNLTEDQTLEMFGKNIKIVPKIDVSGSVLNYIIISFDNFTLNAKNPEFRDNLIEFDIICNFEQWQLEDFKLRPYKIAAEIDSMFNDKHLTGIGTLQFLGANQLLLNDDFGGLCLMYQAIHGEEDKKFMPNPNDEESFIENFDNMFNG